MSLVPQAAMNALESCYSCWRAGGRTGHDPHGFEQGKGNGPGRQMFQHVGVPEDFLTRYPFELSGGMRQRVAIAMALVTVPDLIVLDEPTSALDVLTQANIMNLLKRIKKEMGTSYILITHDVGTSSELADSVAVMYAGQVVEMSDAFRFFDKPLHPYSQMLMASVPRLRRKLNQISLLANHPV
jgi:peptide/nickel transport system ATP-binding protein